MGILVKLDHKCIIPCRKSVLLELQCFNLYIIAVFVFANLVNLLVLCFTISACISIYTYYLSTIVKLTKCVANVGDNESYTCCSHALFDI